MRAAAHRRPSPLALRSTYDRPTMSPVTAQTSHLLTCHPPSLTPLPHNHTFLLRRRLFFPSYDTSATYYHLGYLANRTREPRQDAGVAIIG